MRLTSFTDYALRILIYAGGHPDQRVTVEEASTYFQISRAHVKKVVLTLARAGFLASAKGRAGGFQLARPADQINLGAVICATEPDFGLFECFLTGNQCRISRPCTLPNLANEALGAFLAVFQRHSLADALVRPDYFVLHPVPAGAAPPAPAAQPKRGPRLPQPV